MMENSAIACNDLISTILVTHSDNDDVTKVLPVLSKIGPVHSIFLCLNHLTGQNLGFTYVNFKRASLCGSPENLPEPVTVNDHIFRLSRSTLGNASLRPGSVMLNNIEKNLNEEDLFEICSKFGNILSVKIAEISDSVYKLGFVHFEEEESATKCIENLAEDPENGQKIIASPFPTKSIQARMTQGKDSISNSDSQQDAFVNENVFFHLATFSAIRKVKCLVQDVILEMRMDQIKMLEQQVQMMKVSLQQQAVTVRTSFKFDFQAIKNNVETLNKRARNLFTQKKEANELPNSEILNNIEIAFYRNGIIMDNGEFRSFDEMTTRECIQDLIDGYIPTVLQTRWPNGVLFTIKDLHGIEYQPPQLSFISMPGYVNMRPPMSFGLPALNPWQMRNMPVRHTYLPHPQPQIPAAQNQRPILTSHPSASKPQVTPPPSQLLSLTRKSPVPSHQLQPSTLTENKLASYPLQEKKQMLGEALFPRVQQLAQDDAGRVTGMLLEIDNSELLHMVHSPESLRLKVDEALAVLKSHREKLRVKCETTDDKKTRDETLENKLEQFLLEDSEECFVDKLENGWNPCELFHVNAQEYLQDEDIQVGKKMEDKDETSSVGIQEKDKDETSQGGKKVKDKDETSQGGKKVKDKDETSQGGKREKTKMKHHKVGKK